MSAIVCNSEVVHYEVLGRGKPVVFLHGWAGSWRYWVPTMQSIAYGFRAYAIDLWGFGDTEKANAYYSLEDQSGLLEAFLRELGILGRVALVGHGLGALVAVHYAINHPNQVARMVLANCPLNGVYSNRLLAESPVNLVDWLMPESEHKAMVRAEAEKADSTALTRPLLEFQSLELHENFYESEINALLLYGGHDPLVPPPAELLEEEYPVCMQPFIFENSGHFPMLEEDNQFNRLLREFLEMERDASPRSLELKSQWKRRVR